MTPYLTPYSTASPGCRRTESQCARRKLNTGRPLAGMPERIGDELENRGGVRATGGSNPSPSATKPITALWSRSARAHGDCHPLPAAIARHQELETVWV